MKRLLMALCMCLIFNVIYAQIPVDRQLVADETYIVASGKTSFRLITSNDTISARMNRKFCNEFTRVTMVKKKDRHGEYWEKSFYFKNESWNMVALYIKNNFK